MAAKKKVDVLAEQREHVVDLCSEIAGCVAHNQLKTARGRLDKLILEFGRLEDMKKARTKKS